MIERVKPQSFGQTIQVRLKNNLEGITPPNVDDDETKGYSKGSFWLDHTSSTVYFCFDAQEGAAKWIRQQESQVLWSFFDNFESGWFKSSAFSRIFFEDFEWMFIDNFEIGWFTSGLFSIIFADNFETSWQEPGTYIVQMSDDFEANWFVSNLFVVTFIEDFETNWFVDNPFTKLLDDSFDVGWFIYNLYSQIYTENFENGGY